MLHIKSLLKNNPFATISIIVMVLAFASNLFISDYNTFWILLTGGGDIIDYLGINNESFFGKHQIFRAVTYGYIHTAVWHLCSNAIAIWYLSRFLERKVGSLRFAVTFVLGLIASGVCIILIYDGFQYGASPAIFTIIGCLMVFGLKDKSLVLEYKQQKGFWYIVCYAVLSNVIGIPTLVFHLIGLTTGLIFGAIVPVKVMHEN